MKENRLTLPARVHRYLEYLFLKRHTTIVAYGVIWFHVNTWDLTLLCCADQLVCSSIPGSSDNLDTGRTRTRRLDQETRTLDMWTIISEDMKSRTPHRVLSPLDFTVKGNCVTSAGFSSRKTRKVDGEHLQSDIYPIDGYAPICSCSFR